MAALRESAAAPTSVTRPNTAACAAVIDLAVEVIRGMVATGAWPARWMAAAAG